MKAPRAVRAFAVYFKDTGEWAQHFPGHPIISGTAKDARARVCSFDPKLHGIIPVRIVPVIRGKASKGKRREK